MSSKIITKSDIALLLTLFLTSGFVVKNNLISWTATVLLWVVDFVLLAVSVRRINAKSFFTFAVFIIVAIASMYHNNEIAVQQLGYLFLTYFTMLAYTSIYGVEEFKQSFCRVMAFLCITSLIFFAIYMLVPSMDSRSNVVGTGGLTASNMIIFVKYVGLSRNMSMFWEPGAFQTFIILAMTFELFNEKASAFRLTLYAVTILSTFSSAGYIGLAMVLLLAFLKKSDSATKSIRFWVVSATMLIIVFVYVNQDALFDTSSSTVFGKIIDFLNEEGYNSTVRTSVSTRYYAVIKPVEEFFKDPLLGCGYAGLIERTKLYTYGMNTCTFVNWFAVYGVFYGLIISVGYLKFAKKLGKTNFMAFMIMVVLFVATMSENYVNNPFFLIFMLYGYSSENERRAVPFSQKKHAWALEH